MRNVLFAILILAALSIVPSAAAECVDGGVATACVSVSPYVYSNTAHASVTTADGDSVRAGAQVARDWFGGTRVGTYTDVDSPTADTGAGVGTGAASAAPPSVVNRISLRVTADGETHWLQVRDSNWDGVPDEVILPALLP